MEAGRMTEDRKLEISENCTVYVQVTDQKEIPTREAVQSNVLTPQSLRLMLRSVTDF